MEQYKGQTGLEDSLKNVGKAALNFAKNFVGYEYHGNPVKHQRHKTGTIVGVGTLLLMGVIPGAQPLAAIAGWGMSVYNGSRLYKDNKTIK